MKLKTQEKNMLTRFAERIPGTMAHAERHVHALFDKRSFDAEKLSSVEAAVLQDSIDEKYVPALVESRRARVLSLLIGSIAPYEFLLLGAVTLAASASSTTGAWYSITLKEMKEKFEGMGLRLTKDLLTADMLANALSMYAGIGLAHKMIAYPELVEFVQDPNPVNAARALGALAVSGTVHGALEGILSKKEDASICFDFNDATLAGMTEEQQRFFSKSVDEVEQELIKIGNLQAGVQFNRAVYRCIYGLYLLVSKFDINKVHYHNEVFDELKELRDNYDEKLQPYIERCICVIEAIEKMVNDDDLTQDLERKLKALRKAKDLEPVQQSEVLASILLDTCPLITGFIQKFGEKGITEHRLEIAKVAKPE